MKTNQKTVLVTGAAQGIGQAIALQFAQAGNRVLFCDLKKQDCVATLALLQKQGVEAKAFVCDVSKKKQVDRLFRQIKKEYGHIDILVNNAGIFPFQSFLKMTEKEWDRVIDVNLKSAFLVTQASLKLMKSGSKIVFISSIAAFVSFVGLSHYSASKGALGALVRTLDLELAPLKINVNAVAPGAIDTPGATGKQSAAQKKKSAKAIAWGRFGKAEEIASAVSFLSSEQAEYITGQTLVVDGGYTLV